MSAEADIRVNVFVYWTERNTAQPVPQFRAQEYLIKELLKKIVSLLAFLFSKHTMSYDTLSNAPWAPVVSSQSSPAPSNTAFDCEFKENT